jgi:hypothetical protein
MILQCFIFGNLKQFDSILLIFDSLYTLKDCISKFIGDYIIFNLSNFLNIYFDIFFVLFRNKFDHSFTTVETN